MSEERPRNLILIGYRGCGKSAVGRALSAKLGWPHIDTDQEIERNAGRTIAAIFADEGEAAFRALESAAVAAVATGCGQVISVGGGAVLREENRAALRGAGTVVWLTAPVDLLLARMQTDPQTAQTRPALTTKSAAEEIRHLLGLREPLYASLADHIVATEQQSIPQVVAAILAALGSDQPDRA